MGQQPWLEKVLIVTANHISTACIFFYTSCAGRRRWSLVLEAKRWKNGFRAGDIARQHKRLPGKYKVLSSTPGRKEKKGEKKKRKMALAGKGSRIQRNSCTQVLSGCFGFVTVSCVFSNISAASHDRNWKHEILAFPGSLAAKDVTWPGSDQRETSGRSLDIVI